MVWLHSYDPFGNAFVSTVVAAVPIVLLLGLIAIWHVRIHVAAGVALVAAMLIATLAFGMPAGAMLATTVYGAAYGLFPIGWIILNLIFLYSLTVRKGLFDVLRQHLAHIAPDPRVQVVLIAFAFGAFFEGAAGFGTPVAVTSAILMQLRFPPLLACGLSLIANTAPVAYGALGTPIITLAAVTGLDLLELSAMAGRQLPFFSLLVPFWVVWALAGWRGTLGVWPVCLTAGVAFAVPQYLVSNFHGPWLVDIVSALCSMGAIAALLTVWAPREAWTLPAIRSAFGGRVRDGAGGARGENVGGVGAGGMDARPAREAVVRAWMPWVVLSLVVFAWGLPQVKAALDGLHRPLVDVPLLHRMVQRVPPVAPTDAAPEAAVFAVNYLSATGTGILVSAVLAGVFMGFGLREMARVYVRTIVTVRFSLMTIAAMLALGYVTKYSGADATLGLALARTGVLYPFFGTLLGWLGVALTGSDTASNVLFGSLQRITAEQVGVSPVLMAAANSTGGVMGKMVDAQSIVVASTATNWYGHEGQILRWVFLHSLALAVLMGLLVLLQAYVPPFTRMVVGSGL
jgi:lactate permease